MKVIFNYTVPHTGTHFVMDMCRQGYNSKRWAQIDDQWYGNRYKDGHNFEDDFCDEWLHKIYFANRMKKLAPNHKGLHHKLMNNNIELLITKGHHWQRGKPLEKLLKTEEFNSDVKFISSMRDPFLSIMTRSWQGWYGYGNRADLRRPKEERTKEARRIIQTYVDILTVQPDRMFILPVDGTYSKSTKGRITLYKRLYKHCGLQQNIAGKEFIDKWKPVNTSKSKSFGAGQEETYNNVFEEMKAKYLNGDIDYIRNNTFCSLEFSLLQQEEYLKRLLENTGYSNLLWW